MATPSGDSVPTGPSAIAGLLQGGKWTFGGTPVLTYSLHINGMSTWSTSTAGAVDNAFAAWQAVANLKFQNVTPGGYVAFQDSAADIAVTISYDILDYWPGGAVAGVAGFPDATDAIAYRAQLSQAWSAALAASIVYSEGTYPNPEGDIFLEKTNPNGNPPPVIDPNYAAFLNAHQGGADFATMLHEIGHSLGLKHPHDDGDNGRPLLAEEKDTGFWTVMSYEETSADVVFGNQVTPMPLDILAVQYLYGANMSYRTGSNVYVLETDGRVKTIWDAGGIDTLDASGLGMSLNMDLRPGGFTHHGPGSTTAIAYNVAIEKAIGGSSNDTITGGSANNDLNGGGGGDLLLGGGGNDTLLWAKSDRYDGGVGDGDKLRVTIASIDLTTVADSSIKNVEQIDLTGSGNNRLILKASDLLNISSTTDTLKVLGNAGDSIDIVGKFTRGALSGGFRTYKVGSGILLVDADITNVA
jgi:hypothetical protein